jgi:hypothetical protein
MDLQNIIDILKVQAFEKDEQLYKNTFLEKVLTVMRMPLFKRVNCSSSLLCCTGRCSTGCGNTSIRVGENLTIDKVFFSTYLGAYIFELSSDCGGFYRMTQRGLLARLEHGHATLE